MRCPVCHAEFLASGRRRYCSDACRQAAWRLRHPTPTVAAPAIPTPVIVYQCPDCEARYLNERRCSDCNLFCRRLGPGGPCPHCGEAVAVNDLQNP